MPRKLPPLPLPAQRALQKIGADIRDARRRRRLTAAIVADRARIDRATLWRLERGVPGVSLGVCATVLFVLGLVDRLGAVAAFEADTVGQMLENERLPQRVRMPRAKPAHDDRPPERRRATHEDDS